MQKIRYFLVALLCLATCSNIFAGWELSSWRPGQVLETTLLFHPARFNESWVAPPPQAPVQDVWLRSSDGNRIHAWWFACPDARGAVLFCHGNAGNLSHRARGALALMHVLGKSVLVFDYPGYGYSEGKPTEAGCYAAADVAYDWLTQTATIAPKQIVIFGESLGGGVATDLAVRRQNQALVLACTFASVPEMARERPVTWSLSPLVHNQFDNVSKIGRLRGPVFIAHGDRDQIIPLTEAKKLVEAAHEPKRFFRSKGGTTTTRCYPLSIFHWSIS